MRAAPFDDDARSVLLRDVGAAAAGLTVAWHGASWRDDLALPPEVSRTASPSSSRRRILVGEAIAMIEAAVDAHGPQTLAELSARTGMTTAAVNHALYKGRDRLATVSGSRGQIARYGRRG